MGPPSTADPLLTGYLEASDAGAREAAAAGLMAACEPIIRATVRRRLPEAPWEDLLSDIRVAILTRLRQLPDAPLEDVRGYAAVTAYRVCYGWLREKKPNLARLRNRVRYVLENDPRLKGRCTDDGGELDAERLRPALAGFARGPLPELLMAIFEKHGGGPVSLSSAVRLVAAVQGVHDTPAADVAELKLSREADVSEAILDRRAFLHRLWTEVAQLPVDQRRAMLFNLKGPDGESLIEAIPACGVATLRQIAALVEMDAGSFAELWNQLPLEDRLIAERLGVTRQQVINLRKSARERLARRMRSSWGDILICVAFLLPGWMEGLT